MSINGLPFKLYKYKGVSDGVLDGLSKGKVWFSHLDKLNDPYENDYDYDDSMFFSNLNNYLKTFPDKGMPIEIQNKIDELQAQLEIMQKALEAKANIDEVTYQNNIIDNKIAKIETKTCN